MSKGMKALAAKVDDKRPAGDNDGSRGTVRPTTFGSAPVPDPEVVERPDRRTFTAEFKQRILAEADACAGTGEIGAMLRRHGLYSSHLTSWRRQRDEGTIAGLAPRKRGRRPTPKNPLADQVAHLERENKRLLARAERAERLVELQKKVAELLGDPLPPPPNELVSEESPAAPTRRRR
jgi:transposase-like protein